MNSDSQPSFACIIQHNPLIPPLAMPLNGNNITWGRIRNESNISFYWIFGSYYIMLEIRELWVLCQTSILVYLKEIQTFEQAKIDWVWAAFSPSASWDVLSLTWVDVSSPSQDDSSLSWDGFKSQSRRFKSRPSRDDSSPDRDLSSLSSDIFSPSQDSRDNLILSRENLSPGGDNLGIESFLLFYK